MLAFIVFGATGVVATAAMEGPSEEAVLQDTIRNSV